MKAIKLVQANTEGTNYFIGVADDENKKAIPVVFLKKSSFVSQETFVEFLNKLKIGVAEGYLPKLEVSL